MSRTNSPLDGSLGHHESIQRVSITVQHCVALLLCGREHQHPRLCSTNLASVAVQSLLSVRSLVLPLHQDTHTWLKFATLCRKSGRPKYAHRICRLCCLRLSGASAFRANYDHVICQRSRLRGRTRSLRLSGVPGIFKMVFLIQC